MLVSEFEIEVVCLLHQLQYISSSWENFEFWYSVRSGVVSSQQPMGSPLFEISLMTQWFPIRQCKTIAMVFRATSVPLF